MSRIYDLTQEQEELLNGLCFLDSDDPDDQEERARIERKLEKIRGSAESTVDFLLGIYLEAKTIASARKEAAQAMQRRQKQAEREEERLKSRILEIMQIFDIKRVDGEYAGVSRYLSSGSVYIDDDLDLNTLPDNCRREIPASVEPVKSEIAKRLKAGEDVPGCELIRSEVLRLL